MNAEMRREREAEGDRGGMKGRNEMKLVLKNDVVCFNTHTQIYYLITRVYNI